MARALLPLSLAFSLCWSSSSAYEQQYYVGGVGPNGGTVTSVSVSSELTDTSEEIIGDFLETTYTYTYTETVDEVVEQTSYQTVTVSEERTEELIDTATITTTNTSTSCYSSDVEYCTAGQNLGGGGVVYEMDTSSYDNVNQIDYGATVTSHGSNSVLPPCSQTTGDCQDELKITVRLYEDDQLVSTYNHTYASINWAGSRDFAYSQDVSGVTFDSATLELYGMDAGYYSGYYGPAFSSAFFDVTYDYIYQAIQQIITQTEMRTVLNSTEYDYQSEYIPPIEVDYSDYTAEQDMSFEVSIDPIDSPVMSFEIEIVDTPDGEFEISVTEIESFEEIEEIDIDDAEVDEVMAEADDSESTEPEVVITSEDDQPSEVAEVEAEEEPQQEQDREDGGSYNPVMETVRVAVMNQSQAARSFESYKDVELPAVPFYPPVEIDGGTNYDNPMGMWYSEASDVVWDEMVRSQYE